MQLWAGDATLGWWNSQLFLKVKISGETSRRKSQSFGDVWVESSRKREEQEQRHFVEMSIEFKDIRKSRMPRSGRPKGRKGRRAKWGGTSDSWFPLSAVDTIRHGREVTSLPCVPFLGYFIADSHPAQPWLTLSTQNSGNPDLLRHACVGVGSGGGSLGLVERALFRQRWKYIEFPKQIQMVQVLSVPRIKWWWSFSDSSGHWFHFNYMPGTIKCLTDIMFDSHTRPRARCCWHQGFTDKHAEICEVKCLARRLTLLGFESKAWGHFISSTFQSSSSASPPMKSPQTVQIDGDWNSMISYKMFSRTCGNHRVGELVSQQWS